MLLSNVSLVFITKFNRLLRGFIYIYRSDFSRLPAEELLTLNGFLPYGLLKLYSINRLVYLKYSNLACVLEKEISFDDFKVVDIGTL